VRSAKELGAPPFPSMRAEAFGVSGEGVEEKKEDLKISTRETIVKATIQATKNITKVLRSCRAIIRGTFMKKFYTF